MELFPSLPDDIARECLIRVTYDQFPTVLSVCKAWKIEVDLPDFLRRRKTAGHAERLVVMAQSEVSSDRGGNVIKHKETPVSRLTVCEPETGYWCELPPLPGFLKGLPMFCRLVSVGSNLVMLGGLDPVTWAASNSVFVFNFLSGKWRCGTHMPGPPRSFFGCASDSNRTVYVVGGHDNEKNALRSTLTYDVSKDEWAPLPDMARERDECKAVYHHGKLHVIGGYCTELQGRFERSAETFNIATGNWEDVRDDLLKEAKCPHTCIYNDDELYMCHEGEIVALRGMTWQMVAKLPAKISNVGYTTTWQHKLMVIGCETFGRPYFAYVLDLKTYTWTEVETPDKYSGSVQTGCYLEI